MRKYLGEAVKAGRVLSPVDAHRQLKRKFGHSLSVGEVGNIFATNRAEPAEAGKPAASRSRRKPGRKPNPSPPEPRPAAGKRKVEKRRRKVEKPSARPAPGPSAQPTHREMSAYLIEQVRSGKVSAPKDAHATLKAKFGRSMSFGVVGAILGANRPGGRKRTARKQGRPKRGLAGRPAAARSRSSTGPSRSRGSSRNGAAFAILVHGQDLILAGSRREVIDQVGFLVSRGTDSSSIEVFRRVPVQITTSYDIGL